MKRQIAFFSLIAIALALLAGGCTAVLSRFMPSLSWLPVTMLLFIVAAAIVLLVFAKRIYTEWLRRFTKALDPKHESALHRFPLPALLINSEGEIVHANDRFSQQVTDGVQPVYGSLVQHLFEELTAEVLSKETVVELRHDTHKYTAYISIISRDEHCRYAVYFVDNTKLKDIAEEYEATRPVVLQICIDNLEESTERLRAGDRARISGQIETMLEDWIAAGHGVMQKYGNERFMAVTEYRHLQEMIEDKFSIIKRVRDAFPEIGNAITLSIGVSEGNTIDECRECASLALDMALSRGGDQVAVNTVNGYTFFGGTSQGVERQTKVSVRIKAEELRNLILSSNRVVVTGHRMSDLDCIGSAVALAVTAQNLGVKSVIALQRKSSMAGQLIDRYIQTGCVDLFAEPNEIIPNITKNTLLIIVDTHSEQMLDAPELYTAATRVAIIDHHRLMVNHIKNAQLMHHLPTASSACEMVAELLPYMSGEKVGRMEAEALLAGIMLDTRNFVLRTGVRTFEAAAYLRSLGADTVAVKKMFSESLELYRYKSELVASAKVYKSVAIATSSEDYSARRAAAVQAADELLTVQGVQASFVITQIGGEINISARSFGEYNVQLIMEALGGGGHLTMAATQMRDVSVDEAEAQLKEVLDRYDSEKGLLSES